MMQLEPTASNDQLRHGAVIIRRPILADAVAIHQLVEESETLDMNSQYLYLLLCRDYSLTCRVAEHDGHIIGFVTAYHPPDQRQVLFIWQIAVAETHRGRDVAMRMLVDLLAGLSEPQPWTIEATVTESNQASRNLFASLARRLGCDLRIGEGFHASLFLPAVHEAEQMFYIGPVVAGPGTTDVQKKEATL
jgi:L-2,4-diaminobutyric acid acetyltransferase